MSEFVTTEVQILGNRYVIIEDNIQSNDITSDFFDPNYTVAAHTGKYIWEGCWVFLEYLNEQMGQEFRGKRIIELGSGTGLLGVALAAHGARVVCTDLTPIVDGILAKNIDGNRKSASADESPESWLNGKPVGDVGGTLAALSLDWTLPLDPQLPGAFDCDHVLAAETVWLEELIVPFVETFVALLHRSSSRKGFFEFLDRSVTDTNVFTSIDKLFAEFQTRGCACKKVYSKSSQKLKGKLAHVFVISLPEEK